MWVAQQVLCFETPSPLHFLGPCPQQTPLPMAWAWPLTELGGYILAVCGFSLGHVSRQQLGLWARTTSSVTAVAPCCHVGQTQTVPSIQASPGSPEAPLLPDLTTWPLASFTPLA